jgi:hypothetical protein
LQDDQLDIAWTMPKQPISTAAKIRKLVMNFTKWLLYVLLILVLAYASFKVWEYKGEYEKEKEAKILAKEQEIEFNDFEKKSSNLRSFIGWQSFLDIDNACEWKIHSCLYAWSRG